MKATKVKVSYLGMQSKIVPLGSKMTITLTEDNKTLGDVLVVAYGTTKKSSYAGSASMVTSKELTYLAYPAYLAYLAYPAYLAYLAYLAYFAYPAYKKG